MEPFTWGAVKRNSVIYRYIYIFFTLAYFSLCSVHIHIYGVLGCMLRTFDNGSRQSKSFGELGNLE